MPTLTSLSDLQSLIENSNSSPSQTRAVITRVGYDGKPYQLVLRIEKRSNKIITAIKGFQTNPDELTRLLKLLKTRCGAGGTALDNALELQGDHISKAHVLLEKEGYAVRSA
jgi:translation initiation factor 1